MKKDIMKIRVLFKNKINTVMKYKCIEMWMIKQHFTITSSILFNYRIISKYIHSFAYLLLHLFVLLGTSPAYSFI